MSRSHLTPKQVVKDDGSVQTYWVNPGGRSKAPLMAVALGMVPVAAMGLAACAPGTDDGNTGPTPDPSSTSQPVETEAPTPAPEFNAGDPISAEEAAEMNAAYKNAGSDKAYQLPSGEFVVIKGGQPLPPNVVQAVEAAVIPPYSNTYQSSNFDAAKQEAANNAIDAQEAATGREAAIVVHGMSATASGEEARWFTGVGTKGYNGTSREEAIAHAQKWVDVSPNTRYLIVVDALG